jgi:hypothetical protein
MKMIDQQRLYSPTHISVHCAILASQYRKQAANTQEHNYVEEERQSAIALLLLFLIALVFDHSIQLE